MERGKVQTEVDLRPWSESDLPLLERLLRDPMMTVHIGGPEPLEKIHARHAAYCQSSRDGIEPQFVIVVGPSQSAAGWIGYWEREWQGQAVWETGWMVLPEFQGQGVATQAIKLLVERARTDGKHRFMHAYPSVDNAPSNAICRKAGFVVQGEVDFEYPKGHFMRCNDWRLDLFPDR
jgi:RimJ/RimL family protein N-acetyltransferase